MNDLIAVRVPQMNPNDEHAVLVRWHVDSGTRVSAGQPLAALETTKANFDLEAPEEGFAHFSCPPRTLVKVGAAIAWISEQGTPPPDLSSADATAVATPEIASDDETRFTRKALKLMRERGLTPADFTAMGRIDAAEVERVASQQARAAPASSGQFSDVEPLEQTPSKLLEVEGLTETYRQIVPSVVTLSLSCERIDAHLQALAEKAGPVSLLELAIHEVARLLEEFADLNGYYAEGRAWRYRTVAIGFAINLGRSLRVPVIQNAAQLSQLDIARAVRDLSLRYMRDELRMEDMTGGTFTITDLSGFGVEHFIPVLNQRQAGILGICAERAGSGRRDLVLAFDHRMSDGMRASQFLAALRARLEGEGGE